MGMRDHHHPALHGRFWRSTLWLIAGLLLGFCGRPVAATLTVGDEHQRQVLLDNGGQHTSKTGGFIELGEDDTFKRHA